MARATLHENDAKDLIRAISGFQDDEENFHLCFQYVMSNFKYHKFLDPDSHKIKRTIEGLTEKFKIHCQDNKAAAFDSLVKKFISEPLPSTEKTATDAHYSILSLLLHLADNPVNTEYTQTKKKAVEEVRDDFDWGSYLREGEDEYDPFAEPDSPDWTDDESDSETFQQSSSSRHIQFHQVPTAAAGDVTIAPPVDITYAPDLDPRAEGEGDSVLDYGSSWLERNVMACYWDPGRRAGMREQRSRYIASTLNAHWESHLSDSSEVYVPPEKVIVTEYQVVREVLWMLCGSPDLFMFAWDSDQQCFSVRPFIQLSHLTQVGVQNTLMSLGVYGGMLRCLHAFVEDVVSGGGGGVRGGVREGGGEGGGGRSYGQTQQAFAAALSSYLHDFTQHIACVEKSIKTTGEPSTDRKSVV